MKIKVIAACLAAALASASALADKVTLKSGSFLTGTAGALADGVLAFKSDDLGDLKIKVANIASLESEKPHVVQYLDKSRVEKPLTVKDGAICDGADKLDMANVKAIDPVDEVWHGAVNVSLNCARGNTESDSAAVIANLNRRWDADRLAIDFGYYFAQSGTATAEKTKTEDRIEAEVKHDHFWLDKIYNYEDLHYDRDRIQRLNGRYRLGLGGGYQWLDGTVFESTGKWTFDQEIGLNYVKEDWENNDDESADGFAALRYAHSLHYFPRWADKIDVFHNCEVLPDVDDFEKYLATADLGFTTKIVMGINLLCKIEWEINSQPAAGREKTDTRYLVGLGYKW